MDEVAHRAGAVAEAGRVQAARELATFAGTDCQTGPKNRRLFDEMFELELRRATQSWSPLASISMTF